MFTARTAKTKRSTKPHCITEKVVLGPRQGMRLPLGIFEAAIPPPVFELECDAKEELPSDIAASLERIDKEDEYRLVYFFQNFTDNTYNITVREHCT